MEFKPIEPARRALPTRRPSIKDFMGMDATVMAHPQRGGIDEADAGARASPPSLEVDRQGEDHLAGKLGKAVVRNQSGKQVPQSLLHLADVEFFEGTYPGKVEQHLGGHDLGGGKPAGFEPGFALCRQLLVPLGDKNRTKIINRTENLCNLVVGNHGVGGLLYG